MLAIVEAVHRNHRDIEAILRVLERECDLFRHAERPDYDMMGEIIDYFRSFLNEYHYPKEDHTFNLARKRTAKCDSIIDNIADERAAAALSLQELGDVFRDILNEQRVLRQAFDRAARSFIEHQRRQIDIEERQLFPVASLVLEPADWAELDAELRGEKVGPCSRRLQGRLRAQRTRIIQASLADEAERNRPRKAVDQ